MSVMTMKYQNIRNGWASTCHLCNIPFTEKSGLVKHTAYGYFQTGLFKGTSP